MLLGLLAAVGAEAHDGKAHPDEAAGGAFATPVPGSYALPPLGMAADGAVLTSEGTRARLHALFGDRLVLLSFIYTQCTDAEGCPFATAVLHRLGTRLAREPELVSEVRLLSLSFDPERDTPEVMRKYGESFRRTGADWRFLTTESEAALAPLLEAYSQTRMAETNEAGEETGGLAHLLRVYLIDADQRIRQIYSASLLDSEALVADVKTLLLEDSGARGEIAAKGKGSGAGAASGSGDDRSGYESVAYTTRSLALAARRGQALDLSRRVTHPPRGLPPVPVPADNPITPQKVALGRRLFFDRRLSLNDTISCAMCHVPEQGFANNEMATAVGIEGRTVRRNAPTIYNVAYLERLFHDGRETRLEHQVWGPLLARNEMGNPSIGAVVEKIRGLGDYAERFHEAFPQRGVAVETVGMALASYERTLLSGNSPFDRFQYGDEERALVPAARRGLALFVGKAGCVSCHPTGDEAAIFTDNSFHNTGVGYGASMGDDGHAAQTVQAAPGVTLEVPRAIVAQVSEERPSDLGLYEITQNPADRWVYRTPGLRNAALTAPYMHDGSLATLADVVAFYDRGGIENEGLDSRIRPLGLSESEQGDLVAFLESLTGGDVEELVTDAFAVPVGDVR